MRFLIIHNQAAGNRSNAIFEFERALLQNGDEAVMRVTDGSIRVESLLDDAGQYDAVVVSGGDGTASSALYAMRETGVPILHFPAGTSNLLSVNLENPTESVALAKMVRERRTLSYDLGELELENKPDEQGRPWRTGFDIIAGAGFDAAIMEQAAPLKGILGPAAYLAAALTTPSLKVSRITLELDGRVEECEGTCVLLVNFGKISGQLSITPDNDPRDGLFEVVVIKARQTVMLLPVVIAAFMGREGELLKRSDVASIYKAREVRVAADPPLTIQYDGEPTGILTPFRARALPRTVNLVVSERVQEAAARALPQG